MADDTTPAAAPAPRPAPPLPSGFRPVEAPAAPAPRPAPPLPSGFRPVQSEARELAESDPFFGAHCGSRCGGRGHCNRYRRRHPFWRA
jgi:hypothetical protein